MEDFNFYRDNVAFLYRHFDGFKSNVRFFILSFSNSYTQKS